MDENHDVESARTSFASRAFLAVALMVGFYALAGGLAAGLLWIPWAEWHYAHRIHPKIALLCVVGAFLILKGCFFVGDKWEPPGPELSESEHPKLFAAIREVAEKMGARMPSAVYLVPDVNAFVAEVGGWMGIVGTRRIMGIGLGMLNVDSISQFKATIAHEFGHFQGGDTRLGGFLYRTRASLVRVVQGLGDSWLGKPFEWYGNLFFRVTHALSRRQELTADEYSVRIAGKRAHVEGLRREGVGGVFYERFFEEELNPLASQGCIPENLFEGFRQYTSNLDDDGVFERVQKLLHEQETDPYDTHPALAERLAYAERLPDPGVPDEPELSRLLLGDPDKVERELTRRMAEGVRGRDGEAPRVVAWEEVPAVYAARHSAVAQEVLQKLGNASLDALLARLERGDSAAFARELLPDAFEQPQEEEAELARNIVVSRAAAAIGAAFAALPGSRWESEPGRALGVKLASGEFVNPFEMVAPAVESAEKVGELREKLVGYGLDLARDQAA